jgi:hypothetical protein
MGFITGDWSEASIRPKQHTARLQARAQKAETERKLLEQGYTIGTQGKLEQTKVGEQKEELLLKELSLQKQRIELANNKLALQSSDEALYDFSVSGDAADIQNALSSNEILRGIWAQRGVHGVANLDWDNDDDLFDSKLLGKPEDREEQKKRYFKIWDGESWSLGDSATMARDTGAMTRFNSAKRQTVREVLDKAKGTVTKNAFIQKVEYLHSIQPPVDPQSKHEIAQGLTAKGTGSGAGAFEKKVEYIHSLQPTGAAQSKLAIAQDLISGASKKGDPVVTAYVANMEFKSKYTGTPLSELIAQDLVPEVTPTREEKLYTFATDPKGLGMSAEDAKAFVVQQTKTTPTTSREEKVYNFAVKPEAEGGLGMGATEAKAYTQQHTTSVLRVPAKIVEQDEVEATTTELISDFGGEEAFFNTDFGDNKNYRKAISKVERIERLGGVALSEADKKSMQNIASLLSLDPGKGLTAQETGIVDSFLKGTLEYITDNVEGTAGRAAYATVRNSMRHALYGAALTPAEIKSFNQAFGTLGQQLGPVLTKLKTSFTQVQAKLNMIARLGNPYTAQVRLGASQERVDSIIGALSERVALIERASGGDSLTTIDWAK